MLVGEDAAASYAAVALRATLPEPARPLRDPDDMDAELLAPAVRAAEGRDAAVAWLNAAIQRADHAEAKRRMAELQVSVSK